MKKYVFYFVLIVTIGLVSAFFMKPQEKDYADKWKQVDNFVNQGLPRSAMQVVDQIYIEAKSEGNKPQLIKSLIYRASLQGQYTENHLSGAISQLQIEMENTSGIEKQVLQSLLAELYYNYYLQNRWLINDRTNISAADDETIQTWDAVRFNQVIARNYLSSISNRKELEAIPLKEYSPVLINTSANSLALWPSLYDLLTNRAIDYFSSPDAGLASIGSVFPFSAEQLFSPAEEFVALQINSADSSSYSVRALHLYQQLLSFHLEAGSKAALVDLDLRRLEFVSQNISVRESNSQLYTQSLENLYNKYINDSVCVKVAYNLSNRFVASAGLYDPLIGEDHRYDLNKAEEICEQTIKAYPDHSEINNCRNLLQEIRRIQFNLQTEAAVLPGTPIPGLLNYKNTTTIYLKIVRLETGKEFETNPNFNENEKIKEYLTLPSIYDWIQNLPDTKDHQRHSVEISIPSLPAGKFMIFASADGEFKQETEVTYQEIWVSDLSYMAGNNLQDNSMDLYVLDRGSGNPIPGTSVKVFIKSYDSQNRKYNLTPAGNFTTDENGFILLNKSVDQYNNPMLFMLEKGVDRLPSEGYLNFYKNSNEPKPRITTYFFTDRSIYRPGQTVYFKGIVVEKNGAEQSIKTRFASTVSFIDANRKEIAQLELVTNEFGSFQGTFVIPTGSLNGELRIKNQSGSCRLLVEEYKRPTFKVSFDTLAGQYNFGDTVSLTGKAENYTGTPVIGAQASYRVVRAVRPLPLYGYRGYFPAKREVEIASGITETGFDGSFRVSFVALNEEKDQDKTPFNFIVYADVTDLTGEVQSAETNVNIGENAILLLSDLPELLNSDSDKDIEVRAVNLSGAEINVQAEMEIYHLTTPERLLNKRYWSRPDLTIIPQEEFIRLFPHSPYQDEDNRNKWPKKLIADKQFGLNGKSEIKINDLSLSGPGEYLLVLKAKNEKGDTARIEQFFTSFSPLSKEVPGNPVEWATVSKTKAETGDVVELVLGSAAKKTRYYYEIVNGDETVEKNWIIVGAGQKIIQIPVKESYRGDFAINVRMIRFNRFYNQSFLIKVPFTNKKLDIRLETHREYLYPGQKEEWKVKISGPAGENLLAELMAGMYDASLDQYNPHNWTFNLYQPKANYSQWNSGFFRPESSVSLYNYPVDWLAYTPIQYPQINWFGYLSFYGGPVLRSDAIYSKSVARSADGQDPMMNEGEVASPQIVQEEDQENVIPEKTGTLANEMLRTNFNETAFFYPQLQTDSFGNIVFNFTTPDALTEWKLMMLASTKDLKTGLSEKTFKARKDLMIIPNVPRFVRQGDMLLFSAKVVNYTDQPCDAIASIEFFDALTMKTINILANTDQPAKKLTILPKQSEPVNWQINIPFDVSMLGYRVYVRTDSFTDGEERIFPVLTNRMLVTETMPLNIQGNQSATFTFKKLVDSDKIMMMSTRQNYRFTLEFTSNPAWYAMQALPYLSEPTVDNASSLFTIYYVNALSAFIANSNPKIKNVFENWRNQSPEAFFSKLQTNQELKNIVLNATPWVLEAENETEQKRRIGILFDLNRMAGEKEITLTKLRENQMPGGAWPWFKGMREDRHTTQNIVLGIARLNNEKVIDLEKEHLVRDMTGKATAYLDIEIREDYEKLKKNYPDDLKKRVPSPTQIEYLYTRSLLLGLFPVPAESQEAFSYFSEQAAKHWLKQDIYIQTMTALALFRMENKEKAEAIMRSIMEKSLRDDEMGIYWRKESGWNWFEAPIETQALIIQALYEISSDQQAVEQAKIWLLKQKQTTSWKTSSATAEAVFALLLTGNDLIAGNQLVQVVAGGQQVSPPLENDQEVEAGTGYIKKSWSASEVKGSLGNIEISNPNSGIAWGGAYWQYFENLDRIAQHDSPLKIEKQLFIESVRPQGTEFMKVQDVQALHNGDKVIVRLIITSDREMEYVHLKDMRATAFEPVDRLSGYAWNGGLGFYRNVTDVSTEFFIQYLDKGIFMIEYPVFVTQRGEFSNGIATIQSYYAPEFAAHSEGIRVIVK